MGKTVYITFRIKIFIIVSVAIRSPDDTRISMSRRVFQIAFGVLTLQISLALLIFKRRLPRYVASQGKRSYHFHLIGVFEKVLLLFRFRDSTKYWRIFLNFPWKCSRCS